MKLKKFLVCTLPLIVVTCLYLVSNIYRGYTIGKTIPCWFNLLTGYLCAGCGGTRSFYALLRGDLLSSVKYNAFVPSLVVVGIVIYVRLFLRVVCGKNIHVLPTNDKWVYIMLIVWLGYTILRNIHY